MIIFRELSEIVGTGPAVVALGNFDGVHRGHRVLIDTAVNDAKSKGVKSAVFTFSNHPKNVVSGKRIVKNIVYEEEKIRILEEAGIDYLFDIPFDESIMTMEPSVFVEKLIVNSFRAVETVCGYNYRFGFKAMGDHQFLTEEGKARGFEVKVIGAVKINDKVVSSTLIRRLISEGKMEEISTFLGRNYSISGRVIHGNELGRTIGFPTANIEADDTMALPPNGVYVTRAYVEGEVYEGITNVGNKPTIGRFGKNIETNILGRNDLELYDKPMRVEFLVMERPEKKFDNIESLRNQIASDCDFARRYHDNQK